MITTRSATAGGAARLLVTCPDRPGIVAAIAGFLFERGANIVASDQYSTDPEGGTFLLRMEFRLEHVELGLDQLERQFDQQVATPLRMRWRLTSASRGKRVAILVSREDHCMLDLLWRRRRGELAADFGLVISTDAGLARDVESFGVPFVHVPVPRGGKPQAEAAMLDLLAGRFDLVVLARYMQILSGDFLGAVGAPLINIHHSFLPAFPGADPYLRAWERGVKVIGATAHYVTEELDAGPIIEQDVIRVSHQHRVEDLTHMGRDIERTVLARAVKWHIEDRVLVYGNRTVVF
jgi:formyltetrahydrofolate deformylase